MRRYATERSFAAQGHAIGDSELCQQGRNVEFHRAFRNIEFRGNFLVRAALKNAVQNFLLAPADLHSCSKGSPRGQKFLSPLRGSVQKRLSANDHQFVILRRLASHQAVHSEQTGNFFHRHAPIWVSLDTEPHSARGTLA